MFARVLKAESETKDLMQPRYVVIDKWPGSAYPVGLIFEGETLNPLTKSIIVCKAFPNLFRPLAWYEERDEKDMPEYVKLVFVNKIQFVHKVERWCGFNGNGEPLYNYYNKVKYLSTFSVIELLPATLEEYKTFTGN